MPPSRRASPSTWCARGPPCRAWRRSRSSTPRPPRSRNAAQMSHAAAATRHGAVAIASKQALTSAGPCEPGDVLGAVAGDVVIVGSDLEEVAIEVVARLLSSGGELVTVIAGADAPPRAGRGPGRADRAGTPRRRGQRHRRRPAALPPAARSRVGVVDERTKLDKLLGVRTAGTARQAPRPRARSATCWSSGRAATSSTPPTCPTCTSGKYVVAVAEVKTAVDPAMQKRRGEMLNVTITDGRNDVDLAFFKAWGHKDALVPGVRAVFAGEVGMYRGRWQLTHPAYQVRRGRTSAPRRPSAGRSPSTSRSRGCRTGRSPSACASSSTTSRTCPSRCPPPCARGTGCRGGSRRCAASTCPRRSRRCSGPGSGCATRRRWSCRRCSPSGARRQAADRTTAATPARGRAARGVRRAAAVRADRGPARGRRDPRRGDGRATCPMNRLLQGEVGSGKTVIALRAMLAAVDAGGQAALLAPTEVLAAQHHRSITRDARRPRRGRHARRQRASAPGSPCSPAASPTAARRENLLDAASGDAGIVIGTHALIQEKVQFQDLALVVVDEQHRFGVEQRDALRDKGTQPPHVLVMTATPIPRTVTMTVFGDMETSTLAELPRGRSPITTHVVPADSPALGAAHLGARRRGGRAPAARRTSCARGSATTGDGGVSAERGPPTRGRRPRRSPTSWTAGDDDGESEREARVAAAPRELASVYAVEAACANPALHGLTDRRPARPDGPRGQGRRRWRASPPGEIEVLVSTTVIEVGVDVPNATVMVVVDADRFGVSQLHQLRGRVGPWRPPRAVPAHDVVRGRGVGRAARGGGRHQRRLRARPARPRAAGHR